MVDRVSFLQATLMGVVASTHRETSVVCDVQYETSSGKNELIRVQLPLGVAVKPNESVCVVGEIESGNLVAVSLRSFGVSAASKHNDAKPQSAQVEVQHTTPAQPTTSHVDKNPQGTPKPVVNRPSPFGRPGLPTTRPLPRPVPATRPTATLSKPEHGAQGVAARQNPVPPKMAEESVVPAGLASSPPQKPIVPQPNFRPQPRQAAQDLPVAAQTHAAGTLPASSNAAVGVGARGWSAEIDDYVPSENVAPATTPSSDVERSRPVAKIEQPDRNRTTDYTKPPTKPDAIDLEIPW